MEQITGIEGITLAVVQEDSMATHDDVHLVAIVSRRFAWRLARRERQQRVERLVLEALHRVLTRRTWNSFPRVGQTNDAASVAIALSRQ